MFTKKSLILSSLFALVVSGRLIFFPENLSARELYQLPGTFLSQEKQRIPAILAPKNYKGVEPFFAVSDRPTIAEALEEDLKNHTLVSPENHMIYCPKGGDYYSPGSLGIGVVYIGAPNLPKNGTLTRRWFDSAYRHRADYNRADREANVVIVSGRHRPFLQVKCPAQHHNIIVAQSGRAGADTAQQLTIDEVKNLRYPQRPTVAEIDEYTLPSKTRLQRQKLKEFQSAVTETTIKQRKLNLQDTEILEAARKAAQQYRYFLKPILAIAKASSGFYAERQGKNGEIGIMQIPPSALKLYKIPQGKALALSENFMIGTRYFDRLMQRFDDDFDRALAAYRVGEKNIADISDPVNFPYEAKLFISQVKAFLSPKQPVRLPGA